MPDTPAAGFAAAEAALAEARAAPLSAKRALLAALLIDRAADLAFAARAGDGDILAFRAALAAKAPAIALVFALCALRPDGPHLVTEAVEIPLSDYGSLDVADFMVSLYNGHTVQRVRIAMPDGARHDVHDALASALAALREVVGG